MDPQTGAAPVEPPVITPLVGGDSERNRIITPYRADAFERSLVKLGLIDKHKHLPSRLRNGFPIGEFDTLTRSYTPNNYFRDPKHLDFALEYVQEQVALGRMTGPYTQSKVEEVLGGPFKSAPLSAIDKAGSPGKLRLIQNCSFKHEDGVSMNDFIDPEEYPTTWGTASEVAQIVATAPPGAQAASLDVDSAYRNIPILPDHKPWLVVQVRPGEFYIDHVCPFGPRSGPGLQGQVMDAIVDILTKSRFGDIKKWVDDVVTFRFPDGCNWLGRWVYPYDIEDIFYVTRPLGVPWKPGKCFRYAFLVVYVGFLWNLKKRCVSLPQKKREKTLATVNAFYDKASAGKLSLRDTKCVAGILSHVTFVYTAGRAQLTHIYSFISSFNRDPPKSCAPQPPPPLVLKELQWWREILQRTGFARSLTPRRPCDPSVWVDASTSWGIGVTIGGQWAAWKLIDDWQKNGRDIFWVEMIGLELACLYLEVQGYKDVDIVVHSDNVGVIAAFDKGWSKNPQANLSISRAGLVCTSRNFKLSLEYVNSKSEDNRANNLSRGVIPPNGTRRLPALPSSKVPPGIRHFLTCI